MRVSLQARMMDMKWKKKDLGKRQRLTTILGPRHVDSDRAGPIESLQQIVCEAEYIYLLNSFSAKQTRINSPAMFLF
jgi:hypothetical protein